MLCIFLFVFPFSNVNNGNDLVFSFKFALLIAYSFFFLWFFFCFSLHFYKFGYWVWYYSWHWYLVMVCSFSFLFSLSISHDTLKAESSHLFAIFGRHTSSTWKKKLPNYRCTIILPILWCFSLFIQNHVFCMLVQMMHKIHINWHKNNIIFAFEKLLRQIIFVSLFHSNFADTHFTTLKNTNFYSKK